MGISPDVVIMTRAELSGCEDRAFQRGVARGRFEQNHDNSQKNTPPERAVEKQDPASPDAGGGPFRPEGWKFKDEGGGVVMVQAPSGQCCGIGYMPQGSGTASNILRDLVIEVLRANAPAET